MLLLKEVKVEKRFESGRSRKMSDVMRELVQCNPHWGTADAEIEAPSVENP